MASKEAFRGYVRDRVLSLYDEKSVARIRTINEVGIKREDFLSKLFHPMGLFTNNYLERLVDESKVKLGDEYAIATIGDGEFYVGTDRQLWTPMNIGEKPAPTIDELEPCWKELNHKISDACAIMIEQPNLNSFEVHADDDEHLVATCAWNVDTRQLVRMVGDIRPDEELIYSIDKGTHKEWHHINNKWWAFSDTPFKLVGLTPYIVEVRGIRNTVGIWWQAGIVPKHNIQVVKIVVD